MWNKSSGIAKVEIEVQNEWDLVNKQFGDAIKAVFVRLHPWHMTKWSFPKILASFHDHYKYPL